MASKTTFAPLQEIDLFQPYVKMNNSSRIEYTRLKRLGQLPEGAGKFPDRAPEPEAPVDAQPTTVPIPEAEKSDDDRGALSELARIALALNDAAQDSEEEQRQADRIWNLLNGLTKEAQGRLFARREVRQLFETAAEKEVQVRTDDPPGTIYFRMLNGERIAWTKKPWTWADLYNPPPPKQPMPLKTWTPSRQLNLGWNGLFVTIFADTEVTLPEVFYGVYQDHIRQTRLGEQHARYIYAHSDQPPEDRGMVTQATAVARSTSLRGLRNGINVNLFEPGGGFVPGEPGNAQTAAQLDE